MPTKRTNNPAYITALNSAQTNVQIGKQFNISEHTVRMDKKKLGITAATNTPTPTPDDTHSGRYDYNVGTGEGEFVDVKTDTRLETTTDWAHIFERFGLSPDEYEIVGNTVRCSTWQSSKRTDNGDRDIVNLFSYRASFRKKISEDEALDLPALYAAAREANTTPTPAATGRATVIVWSDPQVGKTGRRGGTKELIERSEKVRAKLRAELAKRQPERVLLADGGDGIEGFESGGNPMFTNDLSLAGQLDLYGTELMEFIKVGLAQAPVTVMGVPSNHAAWRNGKQNLGTPGDDLGLFMHKQVAKITDAANLPVDWVAPEPYDESVAVEFAGTTIGLVHGNQFGPGQAIAWWEKQAFGAGACTRADVLVTAHYHSFSAGVAGRNPVTGRQRWQLGAPTLDNGSDWYRQIKGRDSDPGLMIFDITEDGFDLGTLTILTDQ